MILKEFIPTIKVVDIFLIFSRRETVVFRGNFRLAFATLAR